MVTFHNTVTLKAEIQVIHTGYPDFFHLNICIFCVALASTKHKLKRGVALPVSSQNDKKKGTISASIILHGWTAASFKKSTLLAG